MELFTQYSLWWIIPCIMLGIIYALILYRKDDKLIDTPNWLRSTLAVLRALLVGALAFLLLGPFFRFVEQETQKPLVLIAQDNSSSVVMNGDSSNYRNEYLTALSQLVEDIGDDYEVQTYAFDKQLSNEMNIDFKGKQSDIALALRDMLDRNVNRNIGALILGTDGIYNKGMSPMYVANDAGIPIYTIALGDTTIRRDLLIENVAHNRLAYLGNDFPIEILVKADRYKGRMTRVSVSSGGKVLFTKQLDILDDSFLTEVPVTLSAEQVGRQRFDISLSSLDGELSLTNNRQTIYVDVLDSRQKVLLLFAGPHPDIGAVRRSIEGNNNYEVEAKRFSRFSGSLKDYDLLILHGIPHLRNKAQLLMQEARKDKVPLWLLAGLKTDWKQVQDFGMGIDVQMKGGDNSTEASPSLVQSFSLFKRSEELSRAIPEWPPLITAFADYKAGSSGRVLLEQRIGVVETEQPLWLFSEIDGHKTAITVGEGLWRWRILDHLEHDNHALFDELVSRTVQFLATKEDRRQFRVYAEDRFDEDQNVTLEAELYNQSYDLVNEPEVQVELLDQDGNSFDFVFSRTQNGYFLDAGKLPVGQYSYRASTKFEKQNYSAQGDLVITAIQAESIRTTADHQLLYKMSDVTGGAFFYPSQVGQIAEQIKSKEEIVPVIYSTEQIRELIELKWLFFLFLALLAIEWFVRKFRGAY